MAGGCVRLQLEMANPYESVKIEWDIFPLFTLEQERDGSWFPRDFLGTGFLVSPGLLMTCWHPVAQAAERGKRVVLVGRDRGGRYQPVDLEDLSPDESGRDLASARVSISTAKPWTLGAQLLPSGADVFTFGYPLTDPPNELRPAFQLGGRYLQGYIARSFHFEDPRFGATSSYELDMRAPSGISGAPLVLVNSHEIVGVVYGRHSVETLESFAIRDPKTGETKPEVLQVEHFALAHIAETLREHRSAATRNKPLADLVGR